MASHFFDLSAGPPLIDYLVGAGEDRWQDCQPERLG